MVKWENRVSTAQLMYFTNGQFGHLPEQNGVGVKKTNTIEQIIMGMCTVMSEKTIGNFETREKTMGHG